MKIVEVSSFLDRMKLKLSGSGNTVPYICKYILFLVSAAFTCMMMVTSGETPLEKFLWILLGVCLELGKYYFATVSVNGFLWGRKLNIISRVLIGLMAVACFYVSVQATKGFQLISLHKVNDSSYHNSEDYTKYLEQKKSINDQIATKEGQLKVALESSKSAVEADKTSSTQNTSLIAQYNADIKAWQKQIDSKNAELKNCINLEAKGKSMANTKKGLNNEVTQFKQNIKDATASRDKLSNSNSVGVTSGLTSTLNTELDKLRADLNNLKPDSSNTSSVKNGYSVLFATQEELDNFLFGIGILIELIGITCSIMIESRKKGKGTLRKVVTEWRDDDGQQQPNNQQPETKELPEPTIENAIMAKSETSTHESTQESAPRKIGFGTESVPSKNPEIQTAFEDDGYYTKAELNKYLKIMYGNRKNDWAPGQRLFRENGLSDKAIRGIRFDLNNRGVVRSGEKNTKILVQTIEEAKKRCVTQ